MAPRLRLLAVLGQMALALALPGPAPGTQQSTSVGSPLLVEGAALAPLGLGQLAASKFAGAALLAQVQPSGE